MSIESEDIDAAITAGVMPQTQADALRAFVAERHRSRLEQAGAEDERFRFMTGFNDFFFAIGILLLGFGMMFFTGGVPLPSLVAALLDLGVVRIAGAPHAAGVARHSAVAVLYVFVFLAVPADLATLTSRVSPGQVVGNFWLDAFGLTGLPAAAATKALIGVCRRVALLLALPPALRAAADRREPRAARDGLDQLARWNVSAVVWSIVTLACGLDASLPPPWHSTCPTATA